MVLERDQAEHRLLYRFGIRALDAAKDEWRGRLGDGPGFGDLGAGRRCPRAQGKAVNAGEKQAQGANTHGRANLDRIP